MFTWTEPQEKLELENEKDAFKFSELKKRHRYDKFSSGTHCMFVMSSVILAFGNKLGRCLEKQGDYGISESGSSGTGPSSGFTSLCLPRLSTCLRYARVQLEILGLISWLK